MWSNSEYIWPNAQHNLPNTCTFRQMHLHLAIVGKFDQKCCTFGQMHSTIGQMRAHLAKRCTFGEMPYVSSIGQMRIAFGQNAMHIYYLPKCADWSNAPYKMESSVSNLC